MNLAQLIVTHEATIPESYLDSMGHMNVMWYTHLFGHATGGVFKLIGLDREYCQSQRTGSFALQQVFNYRKEVRVGERVALRSRVLGRTEKLCHFMHYMTKGDPLRGEPLQLAATCEFLGAHIDMTTRRTSPFSPQIAARLDQLIADHATLDWDVTLSGAIRLGLL